MLFKLLIPFCLAALAQSNHDFEVEPSFEAQAIEPMRESFDAELDPKLFNATATERANVGGSKFGAHIERLRLRACRNSAVYLPHFYEGLVVNSRAWKTKGNERFTSVALTDSINHISSSIGAVPFKDDYIFHTWEMLDMNKVSQDIRKSVPNKIYYWTWNAMQQIYIPLYLSEEQRGVAYMLHIYPESSFLLNPPSDTTFTDGLVWAKGNTNRMYKLEINIEGMIRNLDNFSVPDYKKYITSWGLSTTNDANSQSQVAFKQYRQITLEPETITKSTERICSDDPSSLDISWADMRALLQKEFSWL